MIGPEYAQGVGWLAMTVGIVSFQPRKRWHVNSLQALCSLLWAGHYLAIGADAGAIFSGIAFLRGLISLVRHPRVGLVVASFLPLIWALAMVTANGPIDYIPPVAMTMSTLAQASPRVLRLRLFMALASPPWLTYAFLMGSQGGMANESFCLASNVIALYRYHFRPWRMSRKIEKTGGPVMRALS
jgi:hypothetical protein